MRWQESPSQMYQNLKVQKWENMEEKVAALVFQTRLLLI
jgi:hypothetical protein